MAYDEGLAELFRGDLVDVAGISERRMFGGLCFMLNGNMLCGVHKDGGMFRVGKETEARALAVEGAAPMTFTGRPMGGMIDIDDEAIADDEKRAMWLAMAMGFVGAMPTK